MIIIHQIPHYEKSQIIFIDYWKQLINSNFIIIPFIFKYQKNQIDNQKSEIDDEMIL